MEKLSAYPWPGNIRELENVLHRALLLRRSDLVSADAVRFDTEGRPSATTLEQMEREYIARALTAEMGRVADAARRLGIPRSTLYQKIKNYGIQLPARTRTR
jgi:transcriptional regulator of acetoin/glycerol metabolism